MLSVSDFVSKYEKYTDEELYDVHINIEGYSEEAHKALHIVLEQKGGLELLLKRREERKIVETEIQRIAKETVVLGNQGIDAMRIKARASSAILPAEKVKEIIDDQYVEVVSDLEDKKIKPRTVFGSMIGGIIASVVGGVLWGLQMIYSNAIFYLFGVGLVLLCYGIIRIATKQSKNNIVVLMATIFSVGLALLIGQLLFEIIGYRK